MPGQEASSGELLDYIRATTRRPGTPQEVPNQPCLYGMVRRNTPDEISQLTRELATTELREIDPIVFSTAFGWFLNGIEWTRRQFDHKEFPLILIGRFYGTRKEVEYASMMETPHGWIITMPVPLLIRELKGLGADEISNTRFREEYGKVRCRLTLEQHYGALGVHEELHYLAASGNFDLIKIPAPSERERVNKQLESREIGPVRYSLQPHELEALIYEGKFLEETFGSNPHYRVELMFRLLNSLQKIRDRKP